MIATVRDMSHWLELERQKSLTLFKTRAFASAAHEFRNPLNAILGSLDSMSDKVKDEGKPLYETAKQSANFMLHLVNDILDYSQLEVNKILVNRKEANIRNIIKDSNDIFILRA